MLNKVLIVGLGIGKLYQKILSDKNKYTVVTVDSDPLKNPDYLDLEHCYEDHKDFSLGIVCVPNFLHFTIIDEINKLKLCKSILVEKPGGNDPEKWKYYFEREHYSNLFMVKNNVYRTNFGTIHANINKNFNNLKAININWVNADRVPHPGSWFTTKSLAGGGVSMDLMPHLLSMFHKIFLFKASTFKIVKIQKKQNYKLSDILNTEYGDLVVDNPVYDVDDTCNITFRNDLFDVNLNTAWKSELPESKINIELCFDNDYNKIVYELGLCPESAYLAMVNEVLDSNYIVNSMNQLLDEQIHNTLIKIKETKTL